MTRPPPGVTSRPPAFKSAAHYDRSPHCRTVSARIRFLLFLCTAAKKWSGPPPMKYCLVHLHTPHGWRCKFTNLNLTRFFSPVNRIFPRSGFFSDLVKSGGRNLCICTVLAFASVPGGGGRGREQSPEESSENSGFWLHLFSGCANMNCKLFHKDAGPQSRCSDKMI